jgi:hypothetical protein
VPNRILWIRCALVGPAKRFRSWLSEFATWVLKTSWKSLEKGSATENLSEWSSLPNHADLGTRTKNRHLE